MHVRILRELIGSHFVAANLGISCGLVEIGSADVEKQDDRWHVTAMVLSEDGCLFRATMPESSFAEEYQARRLARSLNNWPAECRQETP